MLDLPDRSASATIADAIASPAAALLYAKAYCRVGWHTCFRTRCRQPNDLALGPLSLPVVPDQLVQKEKALVHPKLLAFRPQPHNIDPLLFD